MIQTRLIPRTNSAYDPPMLIRTLLDQSVRYNPEREIIYRDLFRMNYLSFNKRIRSLANLLENLGVTPGDFVGVMDWDSHRYLECFFGIPSYGAILHTINIRLSPAQLLFTINHAEDQLIFIHEDFLPLLNAIKDKLTTAKKYVIFSDKVYAGIPYQPAADLDHEGEYENLLARQSDQYHFHDFDENTWATLFYTTGTTGDPKGVYFSHRQLFMHTMELVTYFCGFQALTFTHQDVYMPITPLFHVHGWGFPLVATLLNCKQVYPGKYEPEILLKLLIQEKVTMSHCVPTILGMLVNNPIADKLDLSRWSVIIGGSALTLGLAKAALRHGIDVKAGYGMSETAPVMSVAHLSEQEKSLGSEEQTGLRIKAGRIAPFVEIEIVDEEGNFLPHDGESIGEVVCRGFHMTQGYFKEPAASENLWRDGWLHTGDVGHIGPNHYLTISDRVKDVIKSGGEWVSSLEIENILSRVSGVIEVAVVGIPDARWGERPLALLTVKSGESVQPDGILSELEACVKTGEINKWYVPDQIRIVDEIPKTSVGKIDKKRIRALWADEKLDTLVKN